MYDTVAAITPSVSVLEPDAFQGGITTEVFEGDGSRVQVRLFRNPSRDGVYEPRFTYWVPEDEETHKTGWLKAEFSVPKMARRRPGETGLSLLDNPTEDDKELGLDRVDALIQQYFGEQRGIRTWKAQRVDYAWNWNVGPLIVVYLAVLQSLRLSTWSRHPYDAAQGVVWKSKGTRGRWVKFYNKGLQLRSSLDEATDILDAAAPGVLRYEVSNYKDAVKYMAARWFGCDQVVGELLHPGRSLYVMARFFDKLGLHDGSVGAEEYLLYRLAEHFGPTRASTAWYVMTLHSRYGNAAFSDLELIKRSTFYSYIKELRENNFLQSQSSEFNAFNDDNNNDDYNNNDYINDDDDIIKEQLPKLSLPIHEAFQRAENLGYLMPAPNKKKGLDAAKNLQNLLGIQPGVALPLTIEQGVSNELYTVDAGSR